MCQDNVLLGIGVTLQTVSLKLRGATCTISGPFPTSIDPSLHFRRVCPKEFSDMNEELNLLMAKGHPPTLKDNM